VKVQKRRRRDTDEQVIERRVFRDRLLPAVPHRHRGIVAVAGGCGLRWGEADRNAESPGQVRIVKFLTRAFAMSG
jgi:hypothetical protein